MLPQNKESRDRLKELQHQLVIKRIESLLMQAKAGQIDGLMVVVHNADLSENSQINQFIFLDGSYRLHPRLALEALQHGVTELFDKITADVTNQLKLDLK